MGKPKTILKRLVKEYPELYGEFLSHENPFQLMVATILSAQCTDIRVNKVTKILFKDYKNPEDYAYGDIRRLKKVIKSTGYYNQKAKNIKAASQMIIEKYNGKVPDKMEELIKIPGVGRKTANIILTHGHGKTEGIAVDTHVRRLAFRLGLTESRNPDIIERDLINAYDIQDWNKINKFLISHGRKICKAPTPICGKCVLKDICPRNGVEKSY